MSRVLHYAPRVAIFLAGVAAAALTRPRRESAGMDPAALEDLKTSLAGLESRIQSREEADASRFGRLGPALATHRMFPAGTNVEFAQIEAPDRIRILIWERGVGPTSSSGTGTSASAVAAAAHGGAAREMDVEAPGGTQHVEWRDDGVYLTGWAELVFEGDWLL